MAQLPIKFTENLQLTASGIQVCRTQSNAMPCEGVANGPQTLTSAADILLSQHR